ncbi:hypothetical protein MXD81_10280, partial [Microbacteriaceae bacterium K1510]|nr:hypothetical protein [Microbacteriaceae bacterium K1510]
EISLSLHHSLQYMSGGNSYWEEKRRLQAVRMRRSGDEWLFSGPWSWAIDHYKRGIEDTVADAGDDAQKGSGEVTLHIGTREESPAIHQADVRDQEDRKNAVEPVSLEEEKAIPVNQDVTQAAYGGTYDRERAAAYAEQHWNS